MRYLQFLFVISFLLVSCSGSDIVFEKHQAFEENTWHRFNKLNIDLPVEKTGKMYDIVFSFVHTSQYQYDNLPVHVTINTPSGEKRINEFNIKVRDKEKGFLGKKEADSIRLHKVLWGGFVFNKKGKAKISIEQIIPKYNTHHIKSVGIILRETDE